MRQLDTLLEKLVDVRRRNAATVRTDIPPTEIVGHDVHDVGLGCGRLVGPTMMAYHEWREEEASEDGSGEQIHCVQWP